MSDLNKIADRVEAIAKKHPQVLEDDKLLILGMMVTEYDLLNKIGVIHYAALKAIVTEMPAFESITRARRKLIEQNRLKASPEVTKKRAERETEIRDWAVGK